jgi:hypothetical protein
MSDNGDTNFCAGVAGFIGFIFDISSTGYTELDSNGFIECHQRWMPMKRFFEICWKAEAVIIRLVVLLGLMHLLWLVIRVDWTR